MNARQFKNLLKEAVAEAVREELQAIFTQAPIKAPIKETKTFNYTSEDVLPISTVRSQLRDRMANEFGFNKPNQQSPIIQQELVPVGGDNPYLAFIEDAKHNMDARDIAGLKNLG